MSLIFRHFIPSMYMSMVYICNGAMKDGMVLAYWNLVGSRCEDGLWFSAVHRCISAIVRYLSIGRTQNTGKQQPHAKASNLKTTAETKSM